MLPREDSGKRRAAVFVPATVGNVGPGFDVLGLAVEGLGDTIFVELVDGDWEVRSVTGRDADLIPREPEKNVATLSARALLERLGIDARPVVEIQRDLPVSGGLGASAAASVGAAVAAARAAGVTASETDLLEAALVGEAAVAGRHLDNIAPALHGGLTLVRSVDPPDVVRVRLAASWWVALVTPNLKINTRDARQVLPESLPQSEWVTVMAQTAALVAAFTTGDAELAARALHDPYAEPRRAHLIPGFDAAKRKALESGAIGCSISGAGPTVFALCPDGMTAHRCTTAMQAELGEGCTVHRGAVARAGARPAPVH